MRDAPGATRWSASPPPSLPPTRDNQFARSRAVAVFAQIDALPHAERQLAIYDRYQHAGTQDSRLKMRGHIVRSLSVMLVVRIILRHGLVKIRLEIAANRGIGIFIDCQRGGRMLDKDLTEPLAQLADGRQGAQHLPRDEVKAATARGKGDGLLFDTHNSR